MDTTFIKTTTLILDNARAIRDRTVQDRDLAIKMGWPINNAKFDEFIGLMNEQIDKLESTMAAYMMANVQGNC